MPGRWRHCGDDCVDIRPTRAAPLAAPGDALRARNASRVGRSVPVLSGSVADANTPAIRGGDRIVVYPAAFSDRRELVAILRHELEHARQWRVQPEAYKASQILECGLSYALIYPGVGGTSLINALPIEADANAAGAKLARDLYGPVPEELAWGNHGAVLRPLGEPNPATLGARTIVWVAMHLAAMESACADHGITAATLAERLISGGTHHLERLAADRELQRVAEEAKAAVPSEQAIAAARSPAAAWTDVVSALRRGEEHGVALIQRAG